jgi:putative tryptophan/tyrosine transport system substrate-binding protein
MSALGDKADMPRSGCPLLNGLLQCICPLMTQSGHDVLRCEMSAYDPKQTLVFPLVFLAALSSSGCNWYYCCPKPQEHRVRRRNFIKIVAVAVWPLAAFAQQAGGTKRIGYLVPLPAEDALNQAREVAFFQGLQQLGWTVGQNVQIDIRRSAGNVESTSKYAAEMIALRPDVIVASGSAAVGPLLQVTHTIPIVFANVPDPVGAGFVDSLARPGGNATGFISFEYGISAKWLELLKEIAPSVKRVAVLRDPVLAVGPAQYGAIQSVAPSFGVELKAVNVRDTAEIERAIVSLAGSGNGGIIVTGSPFATIHRELIIALTVRHKLPAVFFEPFFATTGGLMCYGPDTVDQFRRAATYVDRILKGEKPAELAVQAPTKNLLVINLRTAKALGLTVPPSLIARADEVIE